MQLELWMQHRGKSMKKYDKKKFTIGLILVILAFIVCVAVTVLKTADVDKILYEAESSVLAEMDYDANWVT